MSSWAKGLLSCFLGSVGSLPCSDVAVGKTLMLGPIWLIFIVLRPMVGFVDGTCGAVCVVGVLVDDVL